MKKCLACEREILNLKFCNRSCSAKYNNSKRKPRTEESKRKTGVKLSLFYKQLTIEDKISLGKRVQEVKRKNGFKIKTEKSLNCSYCKSTFIAIRKRNNTWPTLCSDECFINTKRYNAKGIKRQEYNGQSFDSKWEVKVAKWLDENKIKWIKPTVAEIWIDKVGKSRKYFADFYLPDYDLYLDPKNPFCINEQREKLDKVKSQINLIFGSPEYIIEEIKDLVV